MVIVRDFSGKLNMDVSPYRMPKSDYSYALNITRDAQDNGKDGPISNIVGNALVEYTEPEGDNVCIGSYADTLRNRIISFHWNSNGYNSIRLFDNSSRTITKIFENLTDSGDVPILNFDRNIKINGINVIHRDEDGDLLFWNAPNERPGGLNIQDFVNGIYTPVPDYALRLAKQPPLNVLDPQYASDTNVAVNNLKKKLFQFKYRWVYANGFKSTWSPISKVKLPLNAYDVDVESNPKMNNVINLEVLSGGVDYEKIQIAGRESLGEVWGDFFLIDTLDKDDYNIPPGSSYTYKFLNDGAYPILETRESDLLFDYVPDLANTQTLANGNVLVFGGITDGYDPIRRTDINVQLTSQLVDSSGSGTEPATPTVNGVLGKSGGRWVIDFYVGTSIGAGSQYKIKFHGPVYSDPDFDVDVTYTANGVDTQATVANALVALIAVQLAGFPSSVAYISGGHFKVTNNQNPVGGPNYQYDSLVTSATAQILKTGAQPTWNYNSKYRFGLLYFDSYGKTNGVISFVSNNEDPNDFSVTTPDFAISTDISKPETLLQPKLPVVYASINHLPPVWAVRYQWVRTQNQGLLRFLDYITCQLDEDTNYYYLCIANLYKFKEENTGFVPSYQFTEGDRVRIMGKVEDGTSSNYTANYFGDDYEILGIVDRQVGVTPDTLGKFLKIQKPLGGKAYSNKMLVQIYTPALRTNSDSQVFYEFGESYPLYVSGGVKYHVGEDQNQTESQPATFTFEDGDVYYKFRNFYTNTLTIANIFQLGVMDANYSDFYASAVNSNGRPNVIDSNAKKTYNPVLRRFGQSFQQGTDINGLNRFFAEDFDEDNRMYGDIMKMISWNNSIIVFQKFKIGAVPVLQQMTFNVDGTSNLILSSNLLNRIQYYKGEYGVGDFPESISYNNDAIYGWDSNRGVCWRLAQNGLTPISIVANINNFSVLETKIRGGNYKVYGVFDTYTNKYISAFEFVPGLSSAKTLVWNEVENGFESFVSYIPEMMCSLNNLLVTWNNGKLYTHDSALYNVFYGGTFDSSITAVFNDGTLVRKTFQNVTLSADREPATDNPFWEISDMSTNVVSYQSVRQSSLVTLDQFKYQEGEWHSPLRGATGANGSTTNGAPMKGAYLIATFVSKAATNLSMLNAAQISIKDSPKNEK